MKIFLTAEWRNLLNLTYAIPPAKLAPYLPPGLELDLYEGNAHVSLVAFDFLNTRVRGIKVPFHVNFPEINLRFYVRNGAERGVVFIREYVPKHCIALIAKRFYNEPYLSYPLESKHESEGEIQSSSYKIWKGKDAFELKFKTAEEGILPDPGSAERHFTDHSVGYGKDKKGNTLAYRVEHPLWKVAGVEDLDMQLDFGKLYGAEWEFMNGLNPAYSMYADGSEVKVFRSVSLGDEGQEMREEPEEDESVS